MPEVATVESLHEEACRDTGGEHHVGVTLKEVLRLHKEAEAERSRRGDKELAAEVDALTERLRAAESEQAALQQEVAELRSAVGELKASRAGLQARLTAQRSASPLPVPRRKGDRQRMRKDVAAVRNLTMQAGKLEADGREGAALTLLRRSTEVLNPLETGAVLLALRQQQHDKLADNLIHVYGRDQGDQDVLHVALTLHEQGSLEDAGAILQAALE